ncbi:MAG: hypothetical protein J6V71_04185 [Clostridia bacterium]|nr:hypothetical protein [Clostridia bacterium]
MELEKRKYKRKEVSAMIEAYRAQYENLILEYRTRISDLLKENADLTEKLKEMSNREPLIIATLERAEKTSQEISQKAELEYSLEMQRLKKFTEKWDDYFNQLQEKYPHYPTIKKAIKIKDKVNELSKKSNAKKAIEQLDLMIDEKKKFNPKQKIKDYVVATSESGFNLDEVLNPGKLELEDLCKELGLIEE